VLDFTKDERRKGELVVRGFSQNFEKRQLRRVRLSISPHGTTRLPLHGFSCNLVVEDFVKIGRENSGVIKIRHEGHSGWYVAESLLE
jgi:hypothetical protein